MFKTEVKRVLEEFIYDKIQQKEGVVRVDFYCLLNTPGKDNLRETLHSLIHPYSCHDIYVTLNEQNNNTYLFVYKGDKYRSNPKILFRGDWN